jgi:hypothetical protein
MKLRSVGAVFSGICANFLAVPVDAILHATGVFPAPGQDMSDTLFGLAFAYRSIFAVLGGWITARLAPSSPRAHAMALGGLGLLLSTAGTIAQWNLGHHWYPISLIVLCLPASWFGARLSHRS